MTARLENASAIINASLVAISAAAAIILDHVLSHPVKRWSAYISIGAVSLAALIIQNIAETVIANSKAARKSLSGDDYIEGTWIEVYRPKDSRNCHFGVISIRFRDKALVLSATTYDGSDLCSNRGEWNSKCARYESGSLFYFYEENVEGKDITGSGRFIFDRSQGYPRRYHSKIFDPIHVHETVSVGYKIEDKSELEALKTGTSMRNVLRKHLHEAFPHEVDRSPSI